MKIINDTPVFEPEGKMVYLWHLFLICGLTNRPNNCCVFKVSGDTFVSYWEEKQTNENN